MTRRFEGPWRVEPVETEDYPGLLVTEGYRRGSIRSKARGLELWCWVPMALKDGWDDADEDYDGVGFTEDELSRFLYDLLNHRGEFGRLICILADLERDESVRDDAGDLRAWWQVPEQRARLRAALLSCVAAIDEEEADPTEPLFVVEPLET